MWWSSSEGEREKAKEEFEDLPEDMQGRLLQAVGRYLGGATRRGDIDKLGGGIFEFRTHKANNEYRLLFFDWGHLVVGLTAFYKNQQRTPPKYLNRAKERRKRWLDTRGETPPTVPAQRIPTCDT